MSGFVFESVSCKAHQAHIEVSEPMTSIVQRGSSLDSSPTSSSLTIIDLVSSPVWWEAKTNTDLAAELIPEEGNPLPLLATWGLRLHHQTKLSTVGSPSEAEDVESNQPQPQTQHSLPDPSQLTFSHSNDSSQN